MRGHDLSNRVGTMRQQLGGAQGGVSLTQPTISQPTLTLKQSTNPTPTGEGDVQWDTNDDRLVIGNGSGQSVFWPNSSAAWLPQPKFGGGSTGMTGTFSGSYFKIGAIYVCRFDLVFTAKGSSTGGASITNLPASVGTGLGGWIISASVLSSWADSSFDLSGTSASINLVTTTGTTQATHANFNSTSQLRGVIMFT